MTMRKLVESTLVSLDGVVGSPWAWTGPRWDEESRKHALAALDRYEAFVLGRVTYEAFAATWSQVKGDPYLDRINGMPKFVASTTLRQTTWNATLLEGNVVEAIQRLKQQPGKDLIKYGTGKLDRTLIEHGLIDEIQLWVMPVIVGQGQRLYEGVDPASLKLTLESQEAFSNGSVILSYRPNR
jgi:dihydrofolate reductase